MAINVSLINSLSIFMALIVVALVIIILVIYRKRNRKLIARKTLEKVRDFPEEINVIKNVLGEKVKMRDGRKLSRKEFREMRIGSVDDLDRVRKKIRSRSKLFADEILKDKTGLS